MALEIDSLSYGPYGIARSHGRVIMIPATVPGDKVTARVIRSKRNYSIAEVLRITQPSAERREAPCPYITKCGGCPWQPVRYDAQLRAKQRTVEDALTRIGKLQGFAVRPIIPAADEYRYRRRIRLHVNQHRVGFYHPESHDLVEIDACIVAAADADRCIDSVRRWVKQVDAALEYVEIVAGDQPGEIVLVAKFSQDVASGEESVFADLLIREPHIRGLIELAPARRKTWGQTQISLNLEPGIRLIVEADAFTQINPEGNRRLLTHLLNLGQFEPQQRVLELYCGAGNFTLPLAKRTREVIAVESDPAAVKSGKLSMQLNGLGNIRWVSENVHTTLKQLVKGREMFDKIVLDPPRVGAKGVENELATLGAKEIIYVSCNPTTLARDAAGLTKRDYKLSLVQPLDLFPQTFHVEVIATFERERAE